MLCVVSLNVVAPSLRASSFNDTHKSLFHFSFKCFSESLKENIFKQKKVYFFQARLQPQTSDCSHKKEILYSKLKYFFSTCGPTVIPVPPLSLFPLCIYNCLSVCLYVVFLCVCMSVFLSVNISVFLCAVCLCVCVCDCMCDCPSVFHCLFLCLSLSLCLSFSLFLSLCLSLSLSVFLPLSLFFLLYFSLRYSPHPLSLSILTVCLFRSVCPSHRICLPQLLSVSLSLYPTVMLTFL